MNSGGSTSVCPPRRLPFSLSAWGLMGGEGFSGKGVLRRLWLGFSARHCRRNCRGRRGLAAGWSFRGARWGCRAIVARFPRF